MKRYLETLAVSNTSERLEVMSWDVAVSNTSNGSGDHVGRRVGQKDGTIKKRNMPRIFGVGDD